LLRDSAASGRRGISYKTGNNSLFLHAEIKQVVPKIPAQLVLRRMVLSAAIPIKRFMPMPVDRANIDDGLRPVALLAAGQFAGA
jgi:hypothetical protein